MKSSVFSDSSSAKGMTTSKTKVKALGENVLARYSVQIHVDYVIEKDLPEIFSLWGVSATCLLSNDKFLDEIELHP